MQTLLEYIKKKSSSNYNLVSIEYKSGKPIGIRICDDGQDFVLGLNDLGKMEWQKAMDLVRKQGNSLPDKKQWTVINKHRKEVDELLERAGGTPLSRSAGYWSSVEFYSNYVWNYHGGDGTLYNYTKSGTLTVRPIINL